MWLLLGDFSLLLICLASNRQPLTKPHPLPFYLQPNLQLLQQLQGHLPCLRTTTARNDTIHQADPWSCAMWQGRICQEAYSLLPPWLDNMDG